MEKKGGATETMGLQVKPEANERKILVRNRPKGKKRDLESGGFRISIHEELKNGQIQKGKEKELSRRRDKTKEIR